MRGLAAGAPGGRSREASVWCVASTSAGLPAHGAPPRSAARPRRRRARSSRVPGRGPLQRARCARPRAARGGDAVLRATYPDGGASSRDEVRIGLAAGAPAEIVAGSARETGPLRRRGSRRRRRSATATATSSAGVGAAGRDEPGSSRRTGSSPRRPGRAAQEAPLSFALAPGATPRRSRSAPSRGAGSREARTVDARPAAGVPLAFGGGRDRHHRSPRRGADARRRGARETVVAAVRRSRDGVRRRSAPAARALRAGADGPDRAAAAVGRSTSSRASRAASSAGAWRTATGGRSRRGGSSCARDGVELGPVERDGDGGRAAVRRGHGLVAVDDAETGVAALVEVPVIRARRSCRGPRLRVAGRRVGAVRLGTRREPAGPCSGASASISTATGAAGRTSPGSPARASSARAGRSRGADAGGRFHLLELPGRSSRPIAPPTAATRSRRGARRRGAGSSSRRRRGPGGPPRAAPRAGEGAVAHRRGRRGRPAVPGPRRPASGGPSPGGPSPARGWSWAASPRSWRARTAPLVVEVALAPGENRIAVAISGAARARGLPLARAPRRARRGRDARRAGAPERAGTLALVPGRGGGVLTSADLGPGIVLRAGGLPWAPAASSRGLRPASRSSSSTPRAPWSPGRRRPGGAPARRRRLRRGRGLGARVSLAPRHRPRGRRGEGGRRPGGLGGGDRPRRAGSARVGRRPRPAPRRARGRARPRSRPGPSPRRRRGAGRRPERAAGPRLGAGRGGGGAARPRLDPGVRRAGESSAATTAPSSARGWRATATSGRCAWSATAFGATLRRDAGGNGPPTPAHDVLRATGGAALWLSHGEIVPGSEALRIERRDPFTGRLVAGRTLVRAARLRDRVGDRAGGPRGRRSRLGRAARRGADRRSVRRAGGLGRRRLPLRRVGDPGRRRPRRPRRPRPLGPVLGVGARRPRSAPARRYRLGGAVRDRSTSGRSCRCGRRLARTRGRSSRGGAETFPLRRRRACASPPPRRRRATRTRCTSRRAAARGPCAPRGGGAEREHGYSDARVPRGGGRPERGASLVAVDAGPRAWPRPVRGASAAPIRGTPRRARLVERAARRPRGLAGERVEPRRGGGPAERRAASRPARRPPPARAASLRVAPGLDLDVAHHQTLRLTGAAQDPTFTSAGATWARGGVVARRPGRVGPRRSGRGSSSRERRAPGEAVYGTVGADPDAAGRLLGGGSAGTLGRASARARRSSSPRSSSGRTRFGLRQSRGPRRGGVAPRRPRPRALRRAGRAAAARRLRRPAGPRWRPPRRSSRGPVRLAARGEVRDEGGDGTAAAVGGSAEWMVAPSASLSARSAGATAPRAGVEGLELDASVGGALRADRARAPRERRAVRGAAARRAPPGRGLARLALGSAPGARVTVGAGVGIAFWEVAGGSDDRLAGSVRAAVRVGGPWDVAGEYARRAPLGGGAIGALDAVRAEAGVSGARPARARVDARGLRRGRARARVRDEPALPARAARLLNPMTTPPRARPRRRRPRRRAARRARPVARGADGLAPHRAGRAGRGGPLVRPPGRHDLLVAQGVPRPGPALRPSRDLLAPPPARAFPATVPSAAATSRRTARTPAPTSPSRAAAGWWWCSGRARDGPHLPSRPSRPARRTRLPAAPAARRRRPRHAVRRVGTGIGRPLGVDLAGGAVPVATERAWPANARLHWRRPTSRCSRSASPRSRGRRDRRRRGSSRRDGLYLGPPRRGPGRPSTSSTSAAPIVIGGSVRRARGPRGSRRRSEWKGDPLGVGAPRPRRGRPARPRPRDGERHPHGRDRRPLLGTSSRRGHRRSRRPRRPRPGRTSPCTRISSAAGPGDGSAGSSSAGARPRRCGTGRSTRCSSSRPRAAAGCGWRAPAGRVRRRTSASRTSSARRP